MVVDSLIRYIGPPIVLTIKSRVFNEILRQSPIFFKHVLHDFCSLILNAHLAT